VNEILIAFLFRLKIDVVRKTNHYLYENVYGLEYDVYMFIVQSAWSKCVRKRQNISVFMFDLKNGRLVCYEVLC
jgi:hypothetical protein